MELPEEVRPLIDRYVDEQNTFVSRYEMLAYLLVFFNCKEILLKNAYLQVRNRCPKNHGK